MTRSSSQRVCLVTGGGGFIGSHLVERLVARGDRVVVLDNFSTGRRSNLDVLPSESVEVIAADVTEGIGRLAPESFHEVYHLAAAVGVRLVIEKPIRTIETNVHETSAVLEFAARKRTPLLLASTSEVYGKSDKNPFSEDDDVVYGPTTLHRWSYACSKAIDEYLALAYHREQGLPVSIVRLFNTVGPRQVGAYGMVLPRFVEAALAGRPLEVHGDGKQTRCFCDVRDVADQLAIMLSHSACRGRVLNLGHDVPIEIRALAELVVETLGSSSPIRYVPYDEAFGAGFDDLRDRRPDLTRIRAATGFTPRTPLVETIRDVARDLLDSIRTGEVDVTMTPILAQLDANPVPFDMDPVVLDPVDSIRLDTVALSALDLLNEYAHIFITAFLVTLLATPVVRRIAVAANVVDHPDDTRKLHRFPVAYLGGVAVFVGLIGAIGMSYFTSDESTTGYVPVPMAIIVGMIAITFTGLADDVWGWDPRLKIAGQLVAAAALAINDIGVRVAQGALTPVMGGPDEIMLSFGSFHLMNGHLYYWLGTALIALFVLGGCNATNLLDGLDGLLSGVVGIIALGLLAICLVVAPLERRAAEFDAAAARTAADSIRATISDFQTDMQRAPASLGELVSESYLVSLPDLPIGWSMAYDPQSSVVRIVDDRSATARAIVTDLRGGVLNFSEADAEHRLPISIEALIEAGFLHERPELPAGYRLRYDPNTGHFRLEGGESSLSGARIILCLALLGAVLGFLPHNFNPAVIFLGDCGSLLLGYMCVVTILLLGERGQTYLVTAGLIVFSVPIIDTTLAIIRRRLSGASLSVADHQHIHHQLLRAVGGVKRTVLALYGISFLFAVVGVSLVALVSIGLRVRFIYAIALVLFSFIAVIAVKTARRQQRLAATADSSPKSQA